MFKLRFSLIALLLVILIMSCYTIPDNVIDTARANNLPIIITSLHPGHPNSVGGVDLYIRFMNISKKTIKYITFEVTPYNRVGDKMKCEIRGYSNFSGKAQGPFKKGQWGPNGYWENAWYNSWIDHVILNSIIIEFMDGTTIKISDDEKLNSMLYLK